MGVWWLWEDSVGGMWIQKKKIRRIIAHKNPLPCQGTESKHSKVNIGPQFCPNFLKLHRIDENFLTPNCQRLFMKYKVSKSGRRVSKEFSCLWKEGGIHEWRLADPVKNCQFTVLGTTTVPTHCVVRMSHAPLLIGYLLCYSDCPARP